MQAIAAPIVGLFTSVGTAFGATTATAATVGSGIISAVVGGISSMSQARYQAAVATRAAQVQEQNAQRIIAAGQADAQQQDMEAAAAVADDIARSASSGFAVSSPSFVRRRERSRILIEQDRSRIIEDSRLKATNAREQAAASLNEAAAAKKSALFSMLGMGLGVADSMIGGATLASSLTQKRLNSDARKI